MLFFDDEFRNIRDLVSIGVCSILVDEGVDSDVIAGGLKTYAEGKLQWIVGFPEAISYLLNNAWQGHYIYWNKSWLYYP